MPQKRVRIDPDGKVVSQDRQIHVSQDDGAGAPDTVRFRHVGTGTPAGGYRIDFSPYLNGSPFGDATADKTFSVPLGGVIKTVDQNKKPGVYKYDVQNAAGTTVTDDPDVIVD